MAEGYVNPVKKKLCYFCAPCEREFNYTQTSSFISVSSEGSEFSCIRCGKKFTSGFKANVDSTDTSSRDCNICGMSSKQ
ncbi:hypothetical protein TNCT_4491 [Trichonephila clavata]|uniref:Uncharacterized protein n=1 Tax=Trichonephila clavata TaxID=2740835 RepID=A0A8X6FQ75_TRICU|nr:hypothetical protein TNCT_4491 [Trichonephila clavata]